MAVYSMISTHGTHLVVHVQHRHQACAPSMQEHNRGTPRERCATFAESDPDDAARETLFPLPRCPHNQPGFRDISFTMVEGDFQVRPAGQNGVPSSLLIASWITYSLLMASWITSSRASNLPAGFQGNLEDAAGPAQHQLHDPFLFCIC